MNLSLNNLSKINFITEIPTNNKINNLKYINIKIINENKIKKIKKIKKKLVIQGTLNKKGSGAYASFYTFKYNKNIYGLRISQKKDQIRNKKTGKIENINLELQANPILYYLSKTLKNDDCKNSFCQIYDYGNAILPKKINNWDNYQYSVLEYGLMDLDKYIKNVIDFIKQEYKMLFIIDIIILLIKKIKCIHDQNIIHGDIKFENLVVFKGTEENHEIDLLYYNYNKKTNKEERYIIIKFIDFGLSNILTRYGKYNYCLVNYEDIMISPNYMPSEDGVFSRYAKLKNQNNNQNNNQNTIINISSIKKYDNIKNNIKKYYYILSKSFDLFSIIRSFEYSINKFSYKHIRNLKLTNKIYYFYFLFFPNQRAYSNKTINNILEYILIENNNESKFFEKYRIKNGLIDESFIHENLIIEFQKIRELILPKNEKIELFYTYFKIEKNSKINNLLKNILIDYDDKSIFFEKLRDDVGINNETNIHKKLIDKLEKIKEIQQIKNKIQEFKTNSNNRGKNLLEILNFYLKYNNFNNTKSSYYILWDIKNGECYFKKITNSINNNKIVNAYKNKNLNTRLYNIEKKSKLSQDNIHNAKKIGSIFRKSTGIWDKFYFTKKNLLDFTTWNNNPFSSNNI